MTAQRADELSFEALPAGTPEERALAFAFKRGERGAYEQIHERYEARVVSVCRRMLGDPDDAQEAAQEAFLRIYQGLPRFNGRYRLGAWIVRITTNVCLDQLRARNRRPSDPCPIEILDLESPFTEDADPQILFLRHAEGRRVRKVLDSLPPLHRAAIVLRDFEGIAYSDIAETLAISEGQVKALLHRARKGFKRSWAANVASMLLPAGVYKKWFKPWDLPSHASNNVSTVSQAAETAMSTSQGFVATAAQAVNACGGALQNCSQFMADKTAPVVAAVVVGTASVGVAVTTNSEPAPRRERQRTPISSVIAPNPAQPSGPIDSLNIPKAAPPAAAEDDEDTTPPAEEEAPPADEAAAPAPAPVPEPTPAPEPSPTEEAAPPTEPADENPEPQPPATPVEPDGYNFSFGVDVPGTASPCNCMSEPKVLSSTAAVNEDGLQSFDQTVIGSATANATDSFGLKFHHGSQNGSDHAMDFSLFTSEGAYMYSASGTLVERGKTEWGGWTYRYSGRYAVFSRPMISESVPETGTYSAEVVVSWRQTRIVATRLDLTEDVGTK